jgi:hypothetical protein
MVVILALFGILGAVLSKILAEDAREWIAWLTERMIDKSVSRLPVALRERFAEEWRSDVESVPGTLGKFLYSLGFLIVANRVPGVTILDVKDEEKPSQTIDVEPFKVRLLNADVSDMGEDSAIRSTLVFNAITQVLNGLSETERTLMTQVFSTEKDKDAICAEYGISRDFLRIVIHRALLRARLLLSNMQ